MTFCLAELTQQIHSFRANGVKSFQAACAAASEPMALRKSGGVLCRGPGFARLARDTEHLGLDFADH